ncbi:Na+/H+ antiporter NhaA, partial [Williamsia sp.]|uniref:Na+/H+ antiporter NhaA n=1 Tax=Williamsia sp. TaxID=1872085 RepID=UPI002F949243
VFGTTRLLAAFTRATLDTSIRWIDVLGISMLAGIGFTVSLLIGDLAYGEGSHREEYVKIGVLTGSLAAALVASILLRIRNRHYRNVRELEERDDNHDGIPDIYQDLDQNESNS